MEDTGSAIHAGTQHPKEKYEIQRVLGSGSFGVTYLALDLVLEHLVAIKGYAPVRNMQATDGWEPLSGRRI